MNGNVLHRLLALPLLLGLSCAPAHADTIGLTLTNPVQTVSAGRTLSFSATLAAPASNTSPVYLNADSFTVPSPLVLDDSAFFNNFPLYLSPGDNDNDMLFSVAVPLGTSAGDYTGIFVLLGGADGSTQDVLGNVSFTVDVTSGTPVAVSPEPQSWLLCASGAVGVFAAFHKRRLRWSRPGAKK